MPAMFCARALWVLLLCGGTSACSATVFDAARDRAAGELSCPIEQTRAYRAAGGIIVVKGCGHWLRYGCVYSRNTPVCTREGMTEELPLDHE